MTEASGPTFEWAAAVWTAPGGPAGPVDLRGSGTLVSPRLLVTCAHVRPAEGKRLVVTFPFHSSDPHGVFAVVKDDERDEAADVALLHLDRDAPVQPAPFRCLPPARLAGEWSAHGYPTEDRFRDGRVRAVGYPTAGTISAPAALGHVLLRTGDAQKPVVTGFSGTGLWWHQERIVVGIIDASGRTDQRDATAVTLHQAVASFPGSLLHRLASGGVLGADEVAKQSWNLADDPDYTAHFGPRARGVTRGEELGYRFRGRHAALGTIASWLCDVSGPRVLVVTGSPGVGKSAVLGRVVTTADPVLRWDLPPDDDGGPVPEGSITVAVHAKDKTPEDVATVIATAVSLAPPDDPGILGAKVAAALRPGFGSFTVLIDAVDESTDPHRLINQLILPLQAAATEDTPLRVLVGTRREDSHGTSLLAEFGGNATLIDLDSPDYFAEEDLVEYTVATLRRDGDPRPGNPYEHEAVARPVAERIARIARQNFLVAALVARPHADNDLVGVDPDALPDSKDVREALDQYLDSLPDLPALSPRELLSVLAFAEAPGWTAELWRVAATVVHGRTVTADQVTAFAHTPATEFLLERSTARGRTEPVFRLFHQALNDTLLEAYP